MKDYPQINTSLSVTADIAGIMFAMRACLLLVNLNYNHFTTARTQRAVFVLKLAKFTL